MVVLIPIILLIGVLMFVNMAAARFQAVLSVTP